MGPGRTQLKSGKNNNIREFPGGPVVRTQHFHCQGQGSIPGWGIKILQTMRHGQKNKKERKKGKRIITSTIYGVHTTYQMLGYS